MAILTPPEANLPPESMQWGRSVDQNIVNLNDNAERNFANINNQLRQLTSTIETLANNIPKVYEAGPKLKTATITAATGTGTVNTYTANNTFIVGELVDITNLSNTLFNGTYLRIASRTDTQFTVNVTGGPVATITGQSATATQLPNWSYSYSTYEPGGGGTQYYPKLLASIPLGINYLDRSIPYEDGLTFSLTRAGRIIIDMGAELSLYIYGAVAGNDLNSSVTQYYSINNGPWVQNSTSSIGWESYVNTSIAGSDIVSLPAGDYSVRVKWSATVTATGGAIAGANLANPIMRITTI